MNYLIPENFLNEMKQEISIKDNSNLPKISIVMPSYNQVNFIEFSILSVLNQNYPKIELIIIDGGSKDGTSEIIRKYEKFITFWISEEDRGQSDALNKGFKICTGEVYGWLNSDDIYLPDAFKKATTALNKNKDKKIIFGDFLSIDKQNCILDHNHSFDFSLNQFKYEGFHLNAQSMFWRKSVHKNFSGFDINLKNTMDYQMILEFGINEGQNSFFRIPHTLGGFRRYEGQKTGGNPSRALSEHKKIAFKYNYSDKYKFIGKLKWIIFRFRRAWWYAKRGGLSNLAYRLKIAYVKRS
tara:strand:- start:622 stop:1512 length:891 start_codon:yes stop_codon:yes gene_type:complete